MPFYESKTPRVTPEHVLTNILFPAEAQFVAFTVLTTWVSSMSSTRCLLALILCVTLAISASDSARILSTVVAFSLASASINATYCASSSCLKAATSLAASSLACFNRSAFAWMLGAVFASESGGQRARTGDHVSRRSGCLGASGRFRDGTYLPGCLDDLLCLLFGGEKLLDAV